MYLKTGFYREAGKSTFINFNINKLHISSGLRFAGARINSPHRISLQAASAAGRYKTFDSREGEILWKQPKRQR